MCIHYSDLETSNTMQLTDPAMIFANCLLKFVSEPGKGHLTARLRQ